MGASLPSFSQGAFERRLESVSPLPLSAGSKHALYCHYEELRRWNPRISLIGPGTVETLVERHYGESLAALPFLDPPEGHLLDIGSGAGFPGLVLAAACPELRTTLVETRERKRAFLRAASRRSDVRCTCSGVRIASPLPVGLPEEVNYLTLRAVSLPQSVWPDLLELLRKGGMVLIWGGDNEPRLPRGLEQHGRVALEGGERRHLWIFRRRR